MLVYMCACRLRLCVRSGLRLRLTHHLSRPPPHHHALRWRMPPVRWWFLAPGQDARASAGPLSAVNWRGWPYWPCWAPIVGWGGLWVSGPRARSALGWSAAGGACGLAATAPWGAYTVAVGVPPSGSPLPFSGWRPRLSLRWFSWGSRALGVSGCLGPGSFRACFMPCGMGLLFPTHTIKHFTWRNLMNTSALTHTSVHLKHSHWYKNRCSQTHIGLDLLLLQNLFVILVYVVLLNNI